MLEDLRALRGVFWVLETMRVFWSLRLLVDLAADKLFGPPVDPLVDLRVDLLLLAMLVTASLGAGNTCGENVEHHMA